MKASILTVENLDVRTPDRRLLASNLSFKLSEGESLLFEGPNGSGKTSILRTVLGLQKRGAGRVEFHIQADQIAFLPQLGNLRFFLPMTLEDVIRLEINHTHLADEIVELGLLSKNDLNTSWNTASGGERQKTLITRTLLKKPRLLALDEPFNHIDAKARATCSGLLQKYLDGGGSLLMISHEVGLGSLRIDRTLQLGEGVA